MAKTIAKKVARKPREIKVVEGDGEMRKVSDLKPHPYANQVFGKPPKHEIDELLADMEKFGQRDAIDILPDGRVLNGRTRLEAAILGGMKEVRVIVHDLDDDEAKQFILEANLVRHHYDKLTVARVYRELKAFVQGEGKARKTGEGDLRDRLAKRFNISGRSLDRYARMLDAVAEAQQLYRKEVFSDGVMLALARITPEQQKAVLAEVRKADGAKEKNLAATVEIAKLREAAKGKREAAKAEAQNAAEPASAVDDGVFLVIDEAEEVSEDSGEAQREAYRNVLVEMPDGFERLVDHIDDIIGEVMDAEDAVAALNRIVASAQTLIEAEEATAAALAGTPA